MPTIFVAFMSNAKLKSASPESGQALSSVGATESSWQSDCLNPLACMVLWLTFVQDVFRLSIQGRSVLGISLLFCSLSLGADSKFWVYVRSDAMCD